MATYEIKNIVGFAGEGEVTLVWSEPFNATDTTTYYYNRTDSIGGPTGWIALGNRAALKTLNIGDSLTRFIVYKFSGLTNDLKYTFQVEAAPPSTNSGTLNSGLYTSLDIIPSSIKDGEPSVQRLTRGLDNKFSSNQASIVHQVFYVLAIHIRDFYLDLNNQAIPQLNILTSTGGYVDSWGYLFGLSRQVSETDFEFAVRIVKSLLAEKCSPQGLINALQPYSSVPVQVVEGSTDYNRFVMDLSCFGGSATDDGVEHDFDPYELSGYTPGSMSPSVSVPSASRSTVTGWTKTGTVSNNTFPFNPCLWFYTNGTLTQTITGVQVGSTYDISVSVGDPYHGASTGRILLSLGANSDVVPVNATQTIKTVRLTAASNLLTVKCTVGADIIVKDINISLTSSPFPLFGDVLGGSGLDSYLFTVKLRPIATGNPATTDNTLQVVSGILKKFHLAGTTFEIQTI